MRNYRLLEAMDRKGLTARDLSRLTGICTDTISQLINRKRQCRAAVRISISRELGIEPDFIFDEHQTTLVPEPKGNGKK